MDKVKVLIEISGGVLQAVHSNVDLEYVLVDYDNLEMEENESGEIKPELVAYSPDSIHENLWEVFVGFDLESEKIESTVYEELKEINF